MIEAAAILQGQITAQEVQLQVMETYLSPDNPDVARVRSSVEELRKQLYIMESGKGGKGMLPGDRLHPAMITVPELALQFARLFRQVKVQETLFTLLTSQHEQAKIARARDTPTVQVLDQAVPADKRIRPRLLLNVAVAGVCGTCRRRGSHRFLSASTTLVFVRPRGLSDKLTIFQWRWYNPVRLLR